MNLLRLIGIGLNISVHGFFISLAKKLCELMGVSRYSKISGVNRVTTLMILSTLIACQPRDVELGTIAENLEANGIVEVNKVGQRSLSCPGQSDDWDELRVHRNDYEPVVLELTNVAFSNGTLNCMRVGAEVDLVVSGDFSGSKGRVIVRKVILVKYDHLLKNEDFILGKLKAIDVKSTFDRLGKSLKPEHHGTLNIVVFEYVKGSSPDEKKFLKKNESEFIAEHGERLASCDKNYDWTTLDIPKEFHDSIFTGGMRSWVKNGKLNCQRIDLETEIDLKIYNKNKNSCGKVKIIGLARLNLDKVTPDMLSLGSLLKFEEYMAYVDSKMSEKDQGVVTITVFDFIEGSQQDCPEETNP